MKNGFRVAGTLKEFYGELENLKKSQGNILIWQTSDSGERSTFDAKVFSYLANKDQTTINIKPEDSAKSFNQTLPIFIYEEEKGILFKGRYDSFVSGTLKVLADDKVFLKEKRDVARINFHYTKVLVDVIYGEKLTFKGLKLKDISEFGFGILCTESMANALKIGIELGITNLNKVEMPIVLEGVVTHKTSSDRVKGAKKGIVLVGVKFHEQSKLITKVIETLKKNS